MGAELHVGAAKPHHGAAAAPGARPHVQRGRSDQKPHGSPGESDGDTGQSSCVSYFACVCVSVLQLLCGRPVRPVRNPVFSSVIIYSLRVVPFLFFFFTCVMYVRSSFCQRDPSLSEHHGMVAPAVMKIFRSIGPKSVQFLDVVLPAMFSVIK